MTRRLSGILALSAAITTFSITQTAQAGNRQRGWGGFGHAFAGMVAGDLGGYDARLSADAALGEGAGPIVFGGMLGGGGRALLGRRLMLGGKGYALLTPRKSGLHGSARITGGGGGLDVGVALYNNDNWLVYPYLGAQGFGLDLEVTNDSAQPRRLGDLSIPAGESRTFTAGFPMIELGAGVQRLLFSGDNHGGFMIGLELGFLYGFAGDAWQLDELDVAGLGAPGLNGGYLRLTLGGGGFLLGPKRGPRQRRRR